MKAKGPYHLGTAITAVVVVEVLVAAILLPGWFFLLRDMPAFRFENPHYLWALLLGPILCAIFLMHLAWRNRAIAHFASPHTSARAVPGTSTARMLLKFLLFRHGLGMVVIALAGPQFGTRLEEIRSEGVDVIVAVDVSNSMLAQDLRPSRIELARRGLSRLIDRLQGDRLGIVVFAGEAFVQLPITTDRSAAQLFLASVNTGAVNTQGTAIGTAIELAVESFDLDQPGSRAIIVVTDGENHEDDAQGAARLSAEQGIVVHAIGMGTPQGAPIPITRNGQVTGFKKDGNGNTVVSRLNEQMLTEIAAAGNGTYVRATQSDIGMEALLDELRSMDRTETGTWQFTAHESRFQYPLAIGLAMIVLSMAFGERRSARSRSLLKRALPLMMVILAGCGDQRDRLAEASIRSGNVHYMKGEWNEAMNSYDEAGFDARALHNSGKAAYRNRDLSSAVERLISTTEIATDTTLLADAFHDLGNAWSEQAHAADSSSEALAKEISAIRMEGDDITGKVRLAVARDSMQQEQHRYMQLSDSAITQSVKAYRNALRRDPGDDDTRYNLALAQRALAARARERQKQKDQEKKDQELSEHAKALLKKADELVDRYMFKDALDLLQRGLQDDPSLSNKKEYIDKLNVVTKAATAT